MNESETRAELIDPALLQAGWGVVEGSRVRREFPITKGRLQGYAGKRASTLSADYVLVYKNRNLAVIEAKKNTLAYNEGVTQAKDYAERLNIRYTYSTNGTRIYQMDMEEAKEGEVTAYPSPQELWEMTYPREDTVRDRLFAVPFETKGGSWQPRYYQDNAISKTLEAIADDQKRILLTLATGTGKTAIAFQIAWKLFHAKWNLRGDFSRSPRILFLADRNILADQAFNAFGAFEEDAPDGKPMSAGEFLNKLFGDLPKYFKSEAELRRIWSLPDTRKRLLEELAENGYDEAQLGELKKLVKAQNSDLYDVLAYIAYHAQIVPRLERATKAELRLKAYDAPKQAFLNFVLEQYVKEGVNELDDARLKGLLELKYNSIHDAKATIGDIASIRETFVGFQKYLYEDRVVGGEYDEAYLMVAEPDVGYGKKKL